MVKKLNPIKVEKKLKEKNINVFSPKDFERLFAVSSFATSKFIHKYVERDFFKKIRNGLYCLSSNIPSSFELANEIYKPSYISSETALSFYGVIPETTYSITSVSSRSSSSFIFLGKEFSYQKIKKEFFSGYYFEKNNNENFLIAEPEKALFDYLYLLVCNKGELNSRIDISIMRKGKVKQWRKIFNNKKINNFLEEIYDKQGRN